jgi:hypothetical protein
MIAKTLEDVATAALNALGLEGFALEVDPDGVTAFVRVPVRYIHGVAGDFDAPTRLILSKIELALRGFRFEGGRIDSEGVEVMEYRYEVDAAAQVASIEARIGALERAKVIVGGEVRAFAHDGKARRPSELQVSMTIAATYWGGDSANGYTDDTIMIQEAIDEAFGLDLSFTSGDTEGDNEVWHYRMK